MPVISSAIAAVSAAVSAAVAVTTAATIASATVAVATLVGVTGLAVTAVGAITGNKSLLKAGQIMGYVGLAGNLAGFAVGGLSEGFSQFGQRMGDVYSKAWDEGLGSFFSPDVASATAPIPPVDASMNYVPGQDLAARPPWEGQVGATTTYDASGIASSASPTPPLSQEQLGRSILDSTMNNLGASQAQAGIVPGPAAPTAPVPTNVADTAYQASLPSVQLPSADQAIGQSQAAINQTINQGVALPGHLSGAIDLSGASPDLLSWWDKLPDYAKYSLLTTGGRGVAGMAQGYYEGLSAEQRLEFDKLVNTQRENQVQRLNTNNAYSPLLKFNTPSGPAGKGILSTVKR